MIQRKGKKIIIGFLIIVALLIILCSLYLGKEYRADESVYEALTSNETVLVEQQDKKIIFKPRLSSNIGFIFYPGGQVEYTAYAPLLHELAERGIECILIKMPFNLAVLDSNAADGVIEQYPDIRYWYIGGHSLGGSMAASYIDKNRDSFDGLILLAAYSTVNLNESNLKVLSIYGSEDAVLNMKKYKANRGNLPESTVEVIIEGGNHAQFGDYGVQKGDGVALISQGSQLLQTVEAIEVFMLGN